MNLFKDFTLKWWQGSLFKLSAVSFGVAIGSTWPWIFDNLGILLWVLAIAPAIYLTYVWWKQ